MKKSEIEQLQEMNNHLFHKLITLEIIVDSLYSEVVEGGNFDEKSFNSRVAKRVENINNEFEDLEKIAETISTYGMFTNNTQGEA